MRSCLFSRFGPVVVILVLVTAGSDVARATERRFGYIYGSDVLNPGSIELEPWTTFRLGREDFYNRVDHRLEFEAGVSPGLQTAWYLNWTASTREIDGRRETSAEWLGVSWEWKYKLADPVAQPVGAALYLEPALGPSAAAIEAKVILDSRRGDWYPAANLSLEQEWEYEAEETERETGIELDLGLVRYLTGTLSAGLEVRNTNEIPAEGQDRSALFAGPVVGYATDSWWLTASVLPQITAPEGATKDHLDLVNHERVEVRILLGFSL